jgi:ABC-type bacteriocin/lantibiotic exporter with double-glycine peptidase domain
MKLGVPYYSQFVDLPDPFWMLRACGATCLKMVAEYHKIDAPDIVTLCNEAREREGYHMTNGWVHEYLVTKAKELGLQAYRKEGLENFDEIIVSLNAGNPVIVSVEKRVLEQTRFHMIVVVGYEDGKVLYHEPESTDKNRGQYRECTQEVFMEYFRGKAIFTSK